MINVLKVIILEVNFYFYYIDESESLKINVDVVIFSVLIEVINRLKFEFCDFVNIRGSKRGLMIVLV